MNAIAAVQFPTVVIPPPAATIPAQSLLVDAWFVEPAQPARQPRQPTPGWFCGVLEASLVETPTVESWLPAIEQPLRRVPPRRQAGSAFVAEPTAWPAAETITLDKWFQPTQQPPRRPRFPRWHPAWQSPIAEEAVLRGRHYVEARGKYRIFNAAEYRFYRSDSAPPAEDDSPFATGSSLPQTPADTYADGLWYLSVSYFNGVLDSGFLPLGDQGQTYLQLEISGGVEVGNPPQGPLDWRIEVRPEGNLRIHAVYYESSATLRADAWSIAYTTDESTPATDTPDATETITAAGLAVLQYDLPAAQSHGTIVKIRLQTRRNDGSDESPSWVYSDNSTVKTATADAEGPAPPPDLQSWPGSLPEDL